MLRIALAVLIILAFPGVSIAGGTSEELYNECHKLEKAPRDQKALMADVYCAAYVDGVVDGYRIMADLNPSSKMICLPSAGIDNGTIIDIFSKWYKKQKDSKTVPARSGVLLSLKAAYPCK